MGTGDAIKELWPILSVLGSGAVGVILYLRKSVEERLAQVVGLYESRLADKERQIEKLERERDEMKELAFRSVGVSERVVEKVSAPVAPAIQG